MKWYLILLIILGVATVSWLLWKFTRTKKVEVEKEDILFLQVPDVIIDPVLVDPALS